MKLFGIGNALVDLEFQIEDDYLQKQAINKGQMTLIEAQQNHQLYENLTAQYPIKKQCGGGSAANSMVIYSQLGGNCSYNFRVADDDLGKFYVHNLIEQGVNCHSIMGDGETGRCLVMVTPDAERTMLTYLGATSKLNQGDIKEKHLKQADWLFFEGYMVSSENSLNTAIKAIEIAKANDIKIAMSFSDPSMIQFFTKNINKLLNYGIDCIFANLEEIQLWSNSANQELQQAMLELSQFGNIVVITQGAEGSTVYDKSSNTFTHSKAQATKVIDTNGAGDAFAGAFLYGLTQGWKHQNSADLANACASKMISQYGARLEKQAVEQLSNNR